ncbi:transcriptional family alpha beta fold family protein [Moniliophthora roreri]|uniref:AB hydrolase-1 domain-containing protein n=1 Tax=Moniliophthora roreri TaxID=221103 RepID=A0A0W0FVJ1_MONRR|nr:transcriptional family alpha beta fold family protein [Moniliophthora roreri]
MTTIDPKEKILVLPDGRDLAYCENGIPSSNTIVLFLHGLFGVGRADRQMPAWRDAGVHVVVPTLPGFGNSSDRPKSIPYAVSLGRDMAALIEHLHPNEPNLRIYVGGGSYGTAGAQMLYGLPFDIFPYGKNIVGTMLLAPLSPFRHDKDYTKGMTWQNWIGVGPPSQLVPFQLLQRMTSSVIGMKFKTVEKAEAFLRGMLFDKATAEEREAFTKWKAREGVAEGQFEREIAENAVKSIRNWSGFLEGADVLHSDWGFVPSMLDEEHCKRPILIVASKEDPLGTHMATWLAENYKNAQLKWIPGGHISAAWEMDAIWREFMEGIDGN